MNGQIGSPKVFCSTNVEQEILGEAWTNLALVQRQEVYAYTIEGCADRQEILERWVASQRLLTYIDFEKNRLACALHRLYGKAWREGYNSPSSPGLGKISENLEPESSNSQKIFSSETTAISKGGRSGYNKR